MKIKVIGKQKVEYTKKDGTEVKSLNLYYQELENENFTKDLVGNKCEKIYFRQAQVPFDSIDVNSIYEVYFNRWGTPETIHKVENK